MNVRRRMANLAGFVRAARLERAQRPHERLDPPALARLQRARFAAIVRHAAARSRVYAERYRGIDLSGDVEPSALPAVDKPALMERFDDWVTDPRLRLAEVDAYLAGVRDDALYLDEYRICATGGTTGRRGVFAYSRREWDYALAAFLRCIRSFLGLAPRLPRVRIAQVLAVSPLHMTARYGSSTDVGMHRVCRLDARRPPRELAAELAAFRPDVLAGYPSVLALLADEQLAGRLAIAPRTVLTSSEVVTPEMAARIAAAWGAEAFDMYATTETTIIGFECRARRGLHVFEDQVLVENVDERGRPVPDGASGARLLVTNLFNRTQPIIRYEVSDIVRIESAPCPCGRTLRRIVAVEGRSDDVLLLPGEDGTDVAVHPLAVRSPFAAFSDVRQYQVVDDGRRLLARIVPCDESAAEPIAARVRAALRAKLAELGVAPLAIDVEVVAEIARDQNHSGKFKLIESRRPRTAPAPRRAVAR